MLNFFMEFKSFVKVNKEFMSDLAGLLAKQVRAKRYSQLPNYQIVTLSHFQIVEFSNYSTTISSAKTQAGSPFPICQSGQ